MRTVGVIGGMGPAATLDFVARVRRLTPAGKDQDHLRLIVDDNPGLPDRNDAIAGTGPSPGPALARMAAGLEAAGAEVLVMPCNTAHAFETDLRRGSRLPFLSMVEATVDATLAVTDAARVGLLATGGCLGAGLYQRAFANRGVRTVALEGEDLTRFMRLIYAVKAGDAREAADGLAELSAALVSRGAEAIVAACTEVPLVLRAAAADAPLIDSTECLAIRTVTYARG
jgi:aspartate racemase